MIYLCSPFTAKNPDGSFNLELQEERYNQITEITGKLQDRYQYAFIGPITQSHQTAKYMSKNSTEFKAWEIRDLTYISRCDEVWVVKLDGWEESRGVAAEIDFALSLGMPVKSINPNMFLDRTN